MNCDPFVRRSAAERSRHLLVITAGMHGSVAKLNLGIVSLLEGVGRRGQGPFTELLTQAICTLLLLWILFPEAVQGLGWYFDSSTVAICAQCACTTTDPGKTEDNVVLLLPLLAVCWLAQCQAIFWPVCQTCNILQQYSGRSILRIKQEVVGVTQRLCFN